MARAVLQPLGATVRATSTARAAPTTAMRAPPIWTPGSIARGRAARPSCASWAMRSWKTAMANGSAIDGRTTRHAAYKASQVIRKRIEEVFGWTKSAAGLRKTRHRGLGRVGWQFTLTMAAYNLIRLPKLLAAVA